MKMANEKKSIIEEALLEAEQIDAAFKSNAKEILSQTMSSEIEEMVKESLTGSKKRLKEDEEEEETDLELELDTEEGEEEEESEDINLGLEDSDEEEEDSEEIELGDDSDEIDLDLGDAPEEGDTDLDLDMGIEVDDTEFDMAPEMDVVDLTDVNDESKLISVFKKMGPEDEIEVVNDNGTVTLKDNKSGSEYRIEMNSTGGVTSVEAGELGLGENIEGSEEVIYEIVVESDEDYMGGTDYSDYMGGTDYSDYMGGTDYSDYASERDEEEEEEEEDGMTYMKHSKKQMNTFDMDGDGKPFGKKDFEMLRGENDDEDHMRMPRTLGKASKLPNRKSFDIGDNREKMHYESNTPQITKLIKENTNLNTKLTSIESENNELKDTQEKMVEALKQFRKKLQEVAVFNSNLTYAVRLFTENSTTKEEKQEILKRLDSAKDLKESQSIYKQLVKEFTTSKAPIKESIDEKINKTASSGAQISEQSVFVHPELQNMKKLWEYSYKK